VASRDGIVHQLFHSVDVEDRLVLVDCRDCVTNGGSEARGINRRTQHQEHVARAALLKRHIQF